MSSETRLSHVSQLFIQIFKKPLLGLNGDEASKSDLQPSGEVSRITLDYPTLSLYE